MDNAIAPTALFDAELVRRYDMAGPRYTSYPTAPQFQTGFSPQQYLAQVDVSNGDPLPKPLSVYLHLPFCTSPCFYCGCTRIITRDRSRGTNYLSYMQREIRLQSAQFDRDRQVLQLHLGGGSPNFHSPEELGSLLQTLAQNFSLAPPQSREFGIEIDPRMTTPEDLTALHELGFNRISMGVQDFDRQVQEAINRVQGQEPTLELITKAQALGFRSVNVDLIYGLPKQTLQGFDRTLEAIIAARPARIAAYSYAHLPMRFKAQRQINDADMPTPEVKLALLQLTVERLLQAGYVYIGMDHFALPEDELSLALGNGSLQRNFQGYSTHAQCDLIGMGMSSIGNVGDAYVQNRRLLADWQRALDANELAIEKGVLLDADDRLRRSAIQSLMCQGELNFDRFGDRHSIDFRNYFDAELERLLPLATDGLIELDRNHIQVTPRGRFLLRPVAMCFDAYLHQSKGAAAQSPQPSYSKVI